MNTATRDFPAGDLRVSDADRDRALAALSEALQAGRITADELDQRSGQALGARTGKELTAVLADLPLDHTPADAVVVQQARRVVATQAVTGVSAVGAIAMAALAVSNALSSGPSLAQRELAREILARNGLSIPLPPAAGFDWAGTVTPAAIALLLVVLIIALRVARPHHAHPGR